MSRKRPLASSDTSSSSSSYSSNTPAKRRAVQRRTVEKWITENDRELNTTLWLKFDMADREHVASLKCSVCSQFSKKLEDMRNFRAAFINVLPTFAFLRSKTMQPPICILYSCNDPAEEAAII